MASYKFTTTSSALQRLILEHVRRVIPAHYRGVLPPSGGRREGVVWCRFGSMNPEKQREAVGTGEVWCRVGRFGSMNPEKQREAVGTGEVWCRVGPLVGVRGGFTVYL